MRRFILLLLLLIAPRIYAQQKIVVVLDSVRWQLDSMSMVSALSRVEHGGCVVRWRRVTNEATDSITPLHIIPMKADSADSLHIWGSGGCMIGQPMVHTHVVPNGCIDRPSETDINSAIDAPFAFMVFGGTSKVYLYGRKPRVRIDTPEISC